MTTVNDEPCMCGTPFTCLADEHDAAVAVASERRRVIGEMWDFADDLHGITGARWIADALTSTLDRLSEGGTP